MHMSLKNQRIISNHKLLSYSTAESANNRRKKLSKERKSSAQQNLPQSESGNVYSEFNSNSFWPSSEFDSTYSLDNTGFSTPSLGNVMEVIEDGEDIGETSDGFDSEFDDNLDAAGISVQNISVEQKDIDKVQDEAIYFNVPVLN